MYTTEVFFPIFAAGLMCTNRKTLNFHCCQTAETDNAKSTFADKRHSKLLFPVVLVVPTDLTFFGRFYTFWRSAKKNEFNRTVHLENVII